MPGFYDIPEMAEVDYAGLPPLVKKGEDRAEVVDRVVSGWCTSHGETRRDEHIAAGGLVVERVAFVDENTGEPIDLGDLLRAVEERLRREGAPEDFQERSDLHILLRGCRVDRCNAEGVKIRPRFTTFRVKFGADASFASAAFGHAAIFRGATFGDQMSFDSTTFGVLARFDSARFGKWASFGATTFGDDASLHSATFGDWASFDRATFGDCPDFGSAAFGPGASFASATFGQMAVFTWATFGERAYFASATFGWNASFTSATFGDGAYFDSATFDDDVSFLNTTFGSGGGPEQATVGRRESPGFLGLPGFVRRNGRRFDWTTVRSVGQLQVLTRVSYLALVVVPILAGVWPAVRAGVNWVNNDLHRAADKFHAAAARVEELNAYVPTDSTLAEAVRRGTEIIQEVDDHLGRAALREPDMSAGWVLAFVAALLVALAHLIYQLAADETVRAKSKEAFTRERDQEFRECSDGQKRDFLFRAFPWLEQIARMLPAIRHRNLVRRNEQTVWIPSSVEQLSQVGVREGETPAADQGATSLQGENAPTSNASSDVEEDAHSLRPSEPAPAARESKSLPKFSREELELIIIDEGARAEYEVLARQQRAWAGASGTFYLFGAVCIAWLVALQTQAVLRAGGIIPAVDEAGTSAQDYVSPYFRWLVYALLAAYVVAAVVWCVKWLVARLRRREVVPGPTHQ